MSIAAAVNVKKRLIPAVAALRDALDAKAKAWADIVKLGRTHMQDATPVTLGQEWSGCWTTTSRVSRRLSTLPIDLRAAGTAVGTGINSAPGFAEDAAAQIASLTGLPLSPLLTSSQCRPHTMPWSNSPERCANDWQSDVHRPGCSREVFSAAALDPARRQATDQHGQPGGWFFVGCIAAGAAVSVAGDWAWALPVALAGLGVALAC
jgi:hypothetical protein